MAFNASMGLLAGMDPVEPVYDEEIDRSSAVICINQDEEESEAEIWQARLYDALVKDEPKKVVELLSAYNQVRNAPDVTRFSDDEGRTFLMLAVCSKSFKVVHMILRLIDPKLVNNYVSRKNVHGHTALDYAADRRCMRILYTLGTYADRDALNAVNKYLYDPTKERMHRNRRKIIFCLSELSEQDPSEDEDDSLPTQTSPSSSISSDASMADDDMSVGAKTQ